MRPEAKAEPSGTIAYIVDCLADIGEVECKRFFGGWSLHLRGQQFAMVMQGQLYFSAKGAVRDGLIAEGSVPFSYEKADRRVVVGKYLTAPSACLDDPDALCRWTAQVLGNQ